jgi:hypothetical protein
MVHLVGAAGSLWPEKSYLTALASGSFLTNHIIFRNLEITFIFIYFQFLFLFCEREYGTFKNILFVEMNIQN